MVCLYHSVYINKSWWQIKILSAFLDTNIDGKLTRPTPEVKDGGLPFYFILSKIIDLQAAYSPAPRPTINNEMFSLKYNE